MVGLAPSRRTEAAFVRLPAAQVRHCGDVTDTHDPPIPASLTLDEAYRAAFYLVLQYIELERTPDPGLVLLARYMWTDPARWNDWLAAVQRGLADGGIANPSHEGRWEVRPDMPGKWPNP